MDEGSDLGGHSASGCWRGDGEHVGIYCGRHELFWILVAGIRLGVLIVVRPFGRSFCGCVDDGGSACQWPQRKMADCVAESGVFTLPRRLTGVRGSVASGMGSVSAWRNPSTIALLDCSETDVALV